MKLIWIILVLLMVTGCGGVHSLSGDDRDRMIKALNGKESLVLVVHDTNDKQELYGLR